jgi:hypothetical protein
MIDIAVEVHVPDAEDLIGGVLAQLQRWTQQLGLQVVIFIRQTWLKSYGQLF